MDEVGIRGAIGRLDVDVHAGQIRGVRQRRHHQGDTSAYGQRTKLPAGNIARALGETGQIIVVTHALDSDGANGDEPTGSPHMLRSPARESQATAWRGVETYRHAEPLSGNATRWVCGPRGLIAC